MANILLFIIAITTAASDPSSCESLDDAQAEICLMQFMMRQGEGATKQASDPYEGLTGFGHGGGIRPRESTQEPVNPQVGHSPRLSARRSWLGALNCCLRAMTDSRLAARRAATARSLLLTSLLVDCRFQSQSTTTIRD